MPPPPARTIHSLPVQGRGGSLPSRLVRSEHHAHRYAVVMTNASFREARHRHVDRRTAMSSLPWTCPGI
eukprot:scaffold1129_cov376-Prasinococcus_capsulatus_cf.AAC.14